MNKQQSGFTLIELIMVIVVLGALAVSAIPRYVDLQTEADDAATEGVAGSLSAGSAINYAACVAADPACIDNVPAGDMADCHDVPATIAGGVVGAGAAAATGLPTGYTITSAALTAGSGNTTVCTLTHPNTTSTATFTTITPP